MEKTSPQQQNEPIPTTTVLMGSYNHHD